MNESVRTEIWAGMTSAVSLLWSGRPTLYDLSSLPISRAPEAESDQEVYFRLVDVTEVEWHERAQFFAMAAQMMRRILVNSAHAPAAQKEGGMAAKVNLDETAILSVAPDRSVLALDEALTTFSLLAPRQAKVVEMRYFGGLTERRSWQP